MMKEMIKSIFRKFGLEVTRYIPDPREDFVSLKPQNVCRGNVLLALWIKPFLLKDGEPIPNTHSHNWESLQIAKTFLDFGYCVDVIDYHNSEFVPKKDYAFFVSFRTNFERIARRLNNGCIKIVHLDTAHWLFNSSTEYGRCLDLQQRKGATLRSFRSVEPNWAIEYADYATILGNQFTINTYRYAQKPIFRVPISTCAVYPWPEDKDFGNCRKNFLWFGSHGFVHKGLDLVLDVFSEMPDYHLYVCGPIQREPDFMKAYYKELYQTSNIHTIGWVDVSGPEFTETVNKSIGLIYPSCSEGGGGSVIICLHAGLIPIISYESSVDVDDSYGVILKDCSIDTIKNTVQMISSLPAEKLKLMSRKAWEFVRTNHTREKFAEEYKKIITHIIEVHRDKKKLS
jgi:glycosyltransferase involved in cell wall biosynthesis